MAIDFNKDYSKYDAESRNQLYLADIRSAIDNLEKNQQVIVKSVADMGETVKTRLDGLKIELNAIVERVSKLESGGNSDKVSFWDFLKRK